MGQLGFVDLNRRYESLTEKNDPLVAIAAMVPFESFRPKLIAALIKGELRSGTQEFGGTQAMGRSRDPQGSGVAGALQSLRRTGGISGSRSPLVHAFSRPWSRRRGSRRQSPVALSRGAGQGGRGGKIVRLVRWIPERQELSRQGRADHRCFDRIGSKAAQFCNQDLRFAQGERDDQGRQDAGRLEIQAGQGPPEGQGRALDEEA